MLRVSRVPMLFRQVLEVWRFTMVRAGVHHFSGRVSSTCPRSSNCVTEGELPRAPKLVHLVAEIRARGHARPSCPVLADFLMSFGIRSWQHPLDGSHHTTESGSRSLAGCAHCGPRTSHQSATR